MTIMTITTAGYRPSVRLRRLTRLVNAAEQVATRYGDSLSAADDHIARAHGIRITCTSWGGRRYTHPGFAEGGSS